MKKKVIIIIIIISVLFLGFLIGGWIFLNNLIIKNLKSLHMGGPDIYIPPYCDIEINLISTDCSESSCEVTFQRMGNYKEEIEGIIFIFRNSTGDYVLKKTTGNIEHSSIQKLTINLDIEKNEFNNQINHTYLTSPNRVEAVVYVNDTQGVERLCPQTYTLDF